MCVVCLFYGFVCSLSLSLSLSLALYFSLSFSLPLSPFPSRFLARFTRSIHFSPLARLEELCGSLSFMLLPRMPLILAFVLLLSYLRRITGQLFIMHHFTDISRPSEYCSLQGETSMHR